MTNLVCIIQARCGSSRLPGKILMPLADRPALAHTIRRCRAIDGVDQVVCATTDGVADDAVPAVAEAAGGAVYRGSEADVLDRYFQAAKPWGARYVMRVTADCPLLDPAVCSALVKRVLDEDADYGVTVDWPHGLDCEMFTAALLAQAHAEATLNVDREHVTLWMKRREDIRTVRHAPRPGDRTPALQEANRWVLDYPEDYAFLKAVFDRLPPEPPLVGWREVLALVDREPELRAINRQQAEMWRAATAKIYEAGRKGG